MSQRVSTCYSIIDRFLPVAGLYDLTEGIYHGDTTLPYEMAQRHQHDYLLGQARCYRNYRVLDIGCGYGTLLKRMKSFHVKGIGLTLSKEQATHCRNEELDVRIMNYKNCLQVWNKTFDSVIANGSIEHFVQPEDIFEDTQDRIYKQLFSIVHRLINPNSNARRFVTTVIHFKKRPTNPQVLFQFPSYFKKDSDDFHWSVIMRGLGGYYPEKGQLERCAKKYFNLIEEVDGTEDYRITSEYGLNQIYKALGSPKLFKIIYKCIPVLMRYPKQFNTLLNTLIYQSWNWQFRGENPPTCLLRQTWEYK